MFDFFGVLTLAMNLLFSYFIKKSRNLIKLENEVHFQSLHIGSFVLVIVSGLLFSKTFFDPFLLAVIPSIFDFSKSTIFFTIFTNI